MKVTPARLISLGAAILIVVIASLIWRAASSRNSAASRTMPAEEWGRGPFRERSEAIIAAIDNAYRGATNTAQGGRAAFDPARCSAITDAVDSSRSLPLPQDATLAALWESILTSAQGAASACVANDAESFVRHEFAIPEQLSQVRRRLEAL